MSFAFNFSSSDEEDETLITQTTEIEQSQVKTTSQASNKIMSSFTEQMDEEDDGVVIIAQTQTSSKLKAKDDELVKACGEFNPVKDQLGNNTKVLEVTEYTDVIHGVYEGGLKLWECSDDLLQYLSQETNSADYIGKRVIDLGCGHGHPGIWCLTRGSGLVCFQDLNADALAKATIPNVLRICGSNCIIKKNPDTTNDITTTTTTTTTTTDETKDQTDDVNATLATLKKVVIDNKLKGKTDELSSATDTLQYERIKALVLSGEEKDPEMIQWVLDVEEDINLSDIPDAAQVDGEDSKAKQQQDQDEDDDEDDELIVDDGEDEIVKADKLSKVKKSNVIINNGYQTEDFTLLPHATFIYGPWGYYDLEQYMLLNNNYSILALQQQQEEQQQNIKNLSIDNISAMNNIAAAVVRYFNEDISPTTLAPYQTVLQIPITKDGKDMIIKTQIDNNNNNNNTTDLTTLIESLSIDTTNNTIYASVSITPTLITINDIVLPNNKDTTTNIALQTLLNAITHLTTTINTIYTTALQQYQTQQRNAQTGAKIKYPYTTSTVHIPADGNNKQFQLTTVIQTKLQNVVQRGYFTTFVDTGFVETSWDVIEQQQQTQEDNNNNNNNNDDDDDDDNKQSLIQNTPEKINIIMAKAITPQQDFNICNTIPSADVSKLTTALAYIYSKKTTVTTKTGIAKTKVENLWYGSHPLHSPYRYDFILSSDTIYSSPTMPILIQTLRSLLAPKGKAFIAAKRYYFGVGGGTPEFCQHFEMHCPDMKIRSIKEFINGASNIREILLLEWDQDAIKNVW